MHKNTVSVNRTDVMHVTANISGTGTEWNVRAAAYLRCISDAVLCNVFIAQGSFLKSRANTQKIYGYTQAQTSRAAVVGSLRGQGSRVGSKCPHQH